MLTKKKIVYLVKEEQQSAKLYKKLGLHKFALDESRHANFFKRLAAKKGY